MGRQEPMEEQDSVDRWAVGNSLSQVRKPDQHQKYEGHRGQQGVERQRTGQEGNVVFVSRLQRAREKAGGGAIPAAGPQPLQASGSSRSAGDRRRALASASRRSSSSRGEDDAWLLP
jgi:hypothetical protein